MRKATLAMILFWSIIALLLTTALVAGIVFPGSRPGNTLAVIGGADGPTQVFITTQADSEAELLFDQSFAAGAVKTLRVDLTSDEVDIHAVEGEEIRVVQHGVNLDEHRIVNVKQSGSTMTVTTRRQNAWRSTPRLNSRSHVEIYLPKSYRQALELDLTSGSVDVHDDWQLTDFLIDITSGNINTAGIAAETVVVDMTSGHVRLGRVSSTTFRLDSTSGNIQFESLSGSGRVDITSGTVKLDRLELTDKLELDMTSGNISVGLAGNPGIEFRAERTSGIVDTYFDTVSSDRGRELSATVGEAPRRKINVDMTSGTVKIHSVD